jgi:hypothetical protein
VSLERLLVACCVIAAVGQWAVFITIALLRMRYPFELEWLEGGMLEEVRQLLDGKPLPSSTRPFTTTSRRLSAGCSASAFLPRGSSRSSPL